MSTSDGGGGGGRDVQRTYSATMRRSHTAAMASARASMKVDGSVAAHLIDSEPPKSLCSPFWGFFKRKVAPRCRAVNKNRYFQRAMFGALLAALFLPDIWILLNRPDNTDLDVILTLVLAMFLVELSVQSLGFSRSYFGTFFFYMDLLGAVSLLLDLSYLPILALAGGDGESMSSNAVVMRAARIAKLGARAGRFTRLVKLLRFLPGMQDGGPSAGTAKRISARLITTLSTRVSCLIIVMVVIMPLFSTWTYPELDFSMRGWMETLEKAVRDHPERLERQLGRFDKFYSEMNYYPYRVSARPEGDLSSIALASLPWDRPEKVPARIGNVMQLQSANLQYEFNFQAPNMIDATMSLLLMVAIMILMVGFSMVLSNSVSGIVLKPLEGLLVKIRQTASMIFKSVTDIASAVKNDDENSEDEEEEEDDVDPTNAFQNETSLLEKVVRKLAVLNEMSSRARAASQDELGLNEHDRAIISSFEGGKASLSTMDLCNWAADDDTDENANYESIVNAQRAMVENAGLSLDLLNSWNLNPLELDKARNHAAAMFFMGPHNHGISFDQVEMARFLDQAELGYLKTCPYHNWFHAIDVTHCVYRLLHIFSADAFLNSLERYALLLSAICHDVGHPGLNNGFLVESSHDLALRYNDKSPLENMHCAKLFDILSSNGCNILSQLTAPQFQEVRSVSITAILHTDNAQHFAMIKEVQMCHEVNSEILESSHACWRREFPTKEAVDVYRQPETRRLFTSLFLHMADISNSIKPFRISRIWACQVLEEFFMQGDSEKSLGLPVQALNDREKVNRPFSQVGFIEFLVSPLLFAVMQVLPALEPHVELMIQNVVSWHQTWLSETKPSPSESERVALEERIRKLQNRFLELHS